jgi:hypothetical protein
MKHRFANVNSLCRYAAYAFGDAVHTFSMMIFLKGLFLCTAGTPAAWYRTKAPRQLYNITAVQRILKS